MKVYVMDQDGEELLLADIDDEALVDWVETVRHWTFNLAGTVDPEVYQEHEGPHRVELRCDGDGAWSVLLVAT